MSPEDVPRNLTIRAEGRAAHLGAHPHDVIMMTKRFASDEQLIQDADMFLAVDGSILIH